MPQENKAFSISVQTKGKIIGRNGMSNITAIEAWAGTLDVNINGIGQRGFAIHGGLWISYEAMDKLALAWVEKRKLKG
jgi:hypothetical protein